MRLVLWDAGATLGHGGVLLGWNRALERRSVMRDQGQFRSYGRADWLAARNPAVKKGALALHRKINIADEHFFVALLSKAHGLSGVGVLGILGRVVKGTAHADTCSGGQPLWLGETIE